MTRGGAREDSHRAAVVWLLVAILSGSALAQTVTTPSQYYSASPTTLPQAATFKYYVWGEVRSPGVYGLGRSVDIVELISSAGGPTDAAELSRVVVVQGVDQKKTTVDLRRLMGSGTLVYLTPGDVVIVPKSLRYSIRDELVFYSTFLVAINIYLTIANLLKS